MLSQQIRSSASLLDSVDAVRNWRAVALMLATLAIAVLVASLGFFLAQVSFVFVALFLLLAYGVAFYGANAVGMMMMDEARGQPARPMMAAVLGSLAISHRLILLMLLVGVLYLLGALVLALILFLCKIPVLGPLLYVVVFPLSVVVVGVSLFAVPTVVFPLSAPAIWSGGGVMASLSQLSAIARKRLIMVLILMLAVGLIAFLVGSLIGAILFTGTATTALLSVPILGSGGGMGFGGLMGGMMGGGMGGFGGMGGMGGMGGGSGAGHAMAAMVGGGLLFAAAFTLPGLVYLRGACTVYLRAIDGLDLAAEQAAFEQKLAAAREKAKAMQAQAQAAAQQYTTKPAAAEPGQAAAPASDLTGAASPPATPAPTANAAAPTHCPACHGVVAADDRFCGHCGHALEPRPGA